MRKFIYLGLVFAIFCIASCKKDETPVVKDLPPEYVPNYFPLAIGNYWVYENFRIRDNQVELMEELDSIIVIGDTLIRSESYFILDTYIEPTGMSRINILRDSLGYITDPFGRISLTLNRPGEVFYTSIQYDGNNDTVIYQESYINPEEVNLELPAGNFLAINKIIDFIIFPESNMPDSLKYRSTDTYFIDGVGKATDFLFYASGAMSFEKKLIRYHIEQ